MFKRIWRYFISWKKKVFTPLPSQWPNHYILFAASLRLGWFMLHVYFKQKIQFAIVEISTDQSSLKTNMASTMLLPIKHHFSLHTEESTLKSQTILTIRPLHPHRTVTESQYFFFNKISRKRDIVFFVVEPLRSE